MVDKTIEPGVSITLMGAFALRVAGRRQQLHLAGNTKRLFMLLAAHANRGLRRDRIIDAIFSDRAPAKGAAALNTGLWRVKTKIAGYDGLLIETIDDIVRLQVTRPARIDTLDLEMAVAAVTGARRAPFDEARHRALRSSAETNRGEFLEGVADHWALPLRERYAALLIEALTLLMRDAADTGAVERALGYGRGILELDPFREGTQCEVMCLYVQNRQRVQAIRQYQQFAVLLRDELGIEPMAETCAVYERILRGTPLPPDLVPSGDHSVATHGKL